MKEFFNKIGTEFLAEIRKLGKRNLILFGGAYVIVAVLITLSYIIPVDTNYQVGDTARETVISEYTFSYYDKAELKNILNYIEVSKPYYYKPVPSQKTVFKESLKKLLTVLATEKNDDFLIKMKDEGYVFSQNVWQYIQNNRFLLTKYQDRFEYVYSALTRNYWIVDRLPDTGMKNFIIIETVEGITNVSLDKVYIAPMEKDTILFTANSIYPKMNFAFREAMSEILVNLVYPTALIDVEKRNAIVEKELEKNKLKKVIREGELIVTKGDILLPEVLSKILGYQDFRENIAGKRIFLYLICSFLLSVMIVYLFLKLERDSFAKSRNVWITLIFFVLINSFYYLSYISRNYFAIPIFLLIPTVLGAINLPVLLRNTRLSIYLLLMFNLFYLFYPSFQIISLLNLLIVSLSLTLTARLLRNRTDFFFQGLVFGFIELVFALFSYYDRSSNIIGYDLGLSIVFAFANSFTSAIVSLGVVIPLFEKVFNIPTRFRLLELSNPSTSPLLKKLKIEAPGTYNHSMLIGDLMEAAADQLGIDTLMAKVGGFYHDIGKMNNPQYFIENQEQKNPHDEIKPMISVSVIKSHVREGVEIAHKYNLPEEIIDFIREHHGTTTISYFYHQAAGIYGDQNVNREDYTYPGPVPHNKFTAVLQIIDTVEATVRAYVQNSERFSPNNIQDIIEDSVTKRMNEGQFSNCDLTLREIDIIKQTLFKDLQSYYHRRIEYLKKKEKNGN
jgi:putative nucleotidyltransferase with HDIG domain